MQERRLIILFFIYLVLEGALRKWVFPTLSTPLFLVKDLLMGVVFIVYYGKALFYRAAIMPTELLKSEVLLLGGWVFFICGSLVVTGFSFTAFIGLTYYLIMLPLIIVIPRILKDVDDLEQLLLKYVWIAVPVFLLGIVQFNSSPDAYINRYAWTDASLDIATLGQNKARITGTFSYITPYAYYLQFMWLVALALLVLAKTNRARIVLGTVVFLVFINIIMSGSRAPLLIIVLLAIPFVNQFRSILKERGGGLSFIITVTLLGTFVYFTGDVINLLSERNKIAKDSEMRIMGAMFTPVYTFNTINIVGSGVGSTFQGVRETGGAEEVGFDEINADRVGVELGMFGYLFVLCFKCVFLANNWKIYRFATDQHIKTWSLVALCSQASFLWGIPVYSAVAAAFYFGSIGLYIFLRNEQSRLSSLPAESQSYCV